MSAANPSAAPMTRPASSGKGVGQPHTQRIRNEIDRNTIQGVKLPFVVTYASSFDEGYEPAQLEAGTAAAQAQAKATAAAQQQTASGDEKDQGAPAVPPPTTPHIKGWQSAKYCPYPQSLVLKFPGYFDIRKIQILSHQAKIANTIELYAGASPSLNDEDDSQATYTRLGYLSLDPNERSGFKARELKSVYVNARGNFLKLNIKKCYSNQYNPYNQVGIIAINVVGMKADGPFIHPNAASSSQPSDSSHPSSKQSNLTDIIRSLVAQYNCDEKTALKIIELEKAKQQAIAAEDYDEAKKLKIHLESLKEIGGRLAALEKEKVQAVANEDYDLAKQLKKEIDYLRSNAVAAASGGGGGYPPQQQQPSKYKQGLPPHQQQQQQSLSRAQSNKSLGQGGRRNSQDEYDQQQQQYHQQQHHQHHQQQQPHYQDQYDTSQHPDSFHQQLPPHHDQPPQEDDYGQSALPPQQQDEQGGEYAGDPEDRPIRPSRNTAPVTEDDSQNPLSRQPTQYDTYVDGEEDDGSSSSAVPPPEPLSAVHRKDAEPLIDVFGEHTIMCLYSKHWMLRQQAIKDITQSVLENTNELPLKDLFAASCRVLKRGLSDKVSQIFLSSCQFLRVLLNSVSARLKPEDVKQLLDPIVGAMMEKLSSSNVRERDGGLQVLTFLAFDAHVHPSLVPSNLLSPLKKKEKDSPLPLKTRAKVLLKCVIFYGLEDSFNLSLQALTRFVMPHLLHRDAGVRDGMFNLIAGMSSIVGVQKLLPYFKDLRPQTLETLQQKLEDVSNGIIIFLKPTQPSLDQPYVSEADPTHTVNGVPVSSISAGVSAPTPMPASSTSAPTKQPRQPPPQQHQHPQAKQAGGANTKAAHGQQQPQQRQQAGGKHQAAAAAHHDQHTNHTPHQPQHPHHAQQQHDDNSILEENSTDLQAKCQFCGLEDPTFNEDSLDLHYWQNCPILISCKQCEQVIEIPSLNEHLLHECEVKGGYKECATCGEPILASEYAAHLAEQQCQPPQPGMQRCALCHQDVETTDEGWKNHLLVETCPKNTRPVIKH